VPLRFESSQSLERFTQHLKTYFVQFGYQTVETPLIQSSDLFLTRAGDQIVNRLFTFDRLGERVALRPEFPTSAAYRYLQMFPDQQPIVRWQFSGAIFEDDPQQPFKESQQFSVGAELLGMEGAFADAEILTMAANGLSRYGIDDWQMRVGNMQVLRLILDTFQLDRRTIQFILSRLDAFGTAGLGKEYVLEQLDSLMLPHESALDELSLLADALQGASAHRSASAT